MAVVSDSESDILELCGCGPADAEELQPTPTVPDSSDEASDEATTLALGEQTWSSDGEPDFLAALVPSHGNDEPETLAPVDGATEEAPTTVAVAVATPSSSHNSWCQGWMPRPSRRSQEQVASLCMVMRLSKKVAALERVVLDVEENDKTFDDDDEVPDEKKVGFGVQQHHHPHIAQ